MITFPLIPPGSPSTSDVKITPNGIVGENVSPFTGSQQIFENVGEWWEAEIALPAMSRASAAPWLAWMSALRGKSGSFLQGDPGGYVPRGPINAFTDLLRFTEAFDNAIWNKGASGSSLPTVTANTITDPLSTTTADVINFAANSGANNGFVWQVTQSQPVIAGKTFTFSIQMKVASGTASVDIQLEDSSFNAVGAASVTLTTAWQRFSVTGTFPSSSQASNIACFIVYRGAPALGVHVWGAALDRGSAPTTYSRISAAQGPRVSGAGQTGKTLSVVLSDTAALANTLLLLKGDYFQVGSGATQRLYQLLNDVTTDGSSLATFDIFPRLRESPADATPIYFFDCRGTFRLADNPRTWEVSNALLYQGVNLKCKEAF